MLLAISSVQLTNSPDLRRLNTPSLPPFSSRGAYHILHSDDVELLGPKLIWRSKLPNKVKFFGWLVHFDRMNSRANLFFKNIKPVEESHCPACAGVLETGDHIFVTCPRAVRVWDSLHITILEGDQSPPWRIGQALRLPACVRLDEMSSFFGISGKPEML